MAEVPKYDQYSLSELYQALNTIAVDRYPDTFAALKQELDLREPRSKFELEECYYRLNKGKWPEYEELLRRQIDSLGGFASEAKEAITDENRYQTFWRRVGAQIVDSLVFVIPALLLMIVLRPIVESDQLIGIYVEEAFQFVVLAYFIMMHAIFGQTLGKMAAGVKVMDISENRAIGYKQALLRDSVPLVLALVSTAYLVVFGTRYDEEELSGTSKVVGNSIGYIVSSWGIAELVTMLFNKKRRAVHDFIARSVVVRVP